MVNVTDPYGRILGFLDRNIVLLFTLNVLTFILCSKYTCEGFHFLNRCETGFALH
jgi:hypothetical protein